MPVIPDAPNHDGRGEIAARGTGISGNWHGILLRVHAPHCGISDGRWGIVVPLVAGFGYDELKVI